MYLLCKDFCFYLHNSGEGQAVVCGDGEAHFGLVLGSVDDLAVGSHPRVGRHGRERPVEPLQHLQLLGEDLLLRASSI